MSIYFKGNMAERNKQILVIFGIFLIYLIIRIFAWKSTVLLEDTDSLGYLRYIKVFLTFNLGEIIDMDPDAAPFYPFFGALCSSIAGYSVEFGARLCSFLFSLLLFITIIGIGKQIAKPLDVTVGLFILCFNLVLISLSFSVLSEPSYIATVYLGLWLFWTQYKNPKLWKAGLLGVVFAFTFLCRVEGFIYVAIVPFLQGVHFFSNKIKKYDIKRLLSWTILFILCFSLTSAPQIWRVSKKLDSFTLSGRNVWLGLYAYPDIKEISLRDEKIFGLHFDPGQVNLEYFKSNYAAIKRSDTEYFGKLIHFIKGAVDEFGRLYQKNLGILVGLLGIVFFGFGLFAMCQDRHRYDVLLVVAFISFSLIPPLIGGAYIRHIAVIAPIIILVEGIGVVYLSSKLVELYENRFVSRNIFIIVFLASLIGITAYPFYKIFDPPHYNGEYSLEELKEPVAIVKKMAEEELLREPRISAQRGYFAYFANGKQILLPFTDYEGLIRYLDLNNVDFLYLNYRRTTRYPLITAFLNDKQSDNFKLLYSGEDDYGKKIELYRFQKVERIW